MRSAKQRGLSIVMGAVALFVSASGMYAQGTITGRVLARVTNEPLSLAQVSVVGTSLRVSTDAEGRYTLRNAPTGTQQIRAVRVGYVEQKLEAEVSAGQPATLDFHMAQAVIQLAEVVTTATGEQRRVELGNALRRSAMSGPRSRLGARRIW